jgi:hypothetical protein
VTQDITQWFCIEEFAGRRQVFSIQGANSHGLTICFRWNQSDEFCYSPRKDFHDPAIATFPDEKAFLREAKDLPLKLGDTYAIPSPTAITGLPFEDTSEIVHHHIVTRQAGGNDDWSNLRLVHKWAQAQLWARYKGGGRSKQRNCSERASVKGHPSAGGPFRFLASLSFFQENANPRFRCFGYLPLKLPYFLQTRP